MIATAGDLPLWIGTVSQSAFCCFWRFWYWVWLCGFWQQRWWFVSIGSLVRNSKQPLCWCNVICNCHEECSLQQLVMFIYQLVPMQQLALSLSHGGFPPCWRSGHDLQCTALHLAALFAGLFCYLHSTHKFQGLGDKTMNRVGIQGHKAQCTIKSLQENKKWVNLKSTCYHSDYQ